MASRLFVLTLVLIGHLIFGEALVARAQPGGGDFFPHDFAKNPLEDGRERGPLVALPETPRPSDSPAEVEVPDGGGFIELGVAPTPTPESASTPHEEEIAPVGAKTYPVLRVGAIIDCADRARFVESFDELMTTIKRHDFDAGTLFAVCENPPLQQVDMLSFVSRRGTLQGSIEIPSRYDVRASPAWIVGTTEGEFVLEGVRRLGRYFTGNGEFIER